MKINDISLVVSSCDKYEDAWYPYFELLKANWHNHPDKIYLISETKKYETAGLNIISCNYGYDLTWSERLYRTLQKVESKYVFFSLEDFFIKSRVDEKRLQECLKWLEDDQDLAVCRLIYCDEPKLVKTDEYKDFGYANSDIHFRLETQFALWNKETLMSFIDLKEDAWQFERYGTQRIIDTKKKFLWFTPDNKEDRIIDYNIMRNFGKGIAWGHWLWGNKELFERFNIKGVKYYRLGVLSKTTVRLRELHYYNKHKNVFEKIIHPFWKVVVKMRTCIANIFMFGLFKGIKYTIDNR